MKAYLMTEVMASKSEQYPKGSTVLFWGGWSEYSVVNENAIRSEAV
jgi:NADPH-dependent curcumin reductase CurA